MSSRLVPDTCPGVLWLHSHDIPISAETQITVRPWSSAFRARHIIVPTEAARSITIRRILVGVRSQLDHGESLDAETLASDPLIDLAPFRDGRGPHPIGARLFTLLVQRRKARPMDTLACAMDFSIVIAPRNPSTHIPKPFEAFLLGTMTDPPRNR